MVLNIIRRKDLFFKLHKLQIDPEEVRIEEIKQELRKIEEEEEKVPENRIIGLSLARDGEKVVNASVMQSHVSAESEELDNTATAQMNADYD